MKLMTKQELIKSISWTYFGNTKCYIVSMKGAGHIYDTKNRTKCLMFIAELKAKILLMDNVVTPVQVSKGIKIVDKSES